MIETITKFKVEINGKNYIFLCDSDSPLGSVHDALTQMRAVVIQKIVELDKPKDEAK